MVITIGVDAGLDMVPPLTSNELDFPTSLSKSDLGNGPPSPQHPELYTIESLPGKGRGLIARVDIAKGTRILVEKPLLTTINLSPIHVMEATITAKLKALSKHQQREFLFLHNRLPGKYPFSGIVKTNALPCGPDSVIGGIYSTISLINHSCIPNAHNFWNEEMKWETIHAGQDIQAGEEICITYTKGASFEERRDHLQQKFGFECKCVLCVSPPSKIQESETRRLQMEHLDETIGNEKRIMRNPAQSLSDCRQLLHLINAEYPAASPLLARLYYDALQICITHGDQARAKVFAERAYDARVICEGGDSPSAREMKKMKENPAQHRNFGASTRWKTNKARIPKNLDTGEFEKWLWREGR